MAAAPQPVAQESLVVSRDLRVAVDDGEGGSRIVDVQAGEPWPSEALGRIDVLIRTGYVIRFDENGVLDKRSWRFARRLGIARPPKAQVRSFLQRARALAQEVEVDGRRIRVYAGRPDDAGGGDLYVVAGRAYALRRGAPDGPAAREALRSDGGPHAAPRRRAAGEAESKKRRRRRKPTE